MNPPTVRTDESTPPASVSTCPLPRTIVEPSSLLASSAASIASLDSRPSLIGSTASERSTEYDPKLMVRTLSSQSTAVVRSDAAASGGSISETDDTTPPTISAPTNNNPMSTVK